MGHELSYVRLVAQQTQQYSGSIKAAADKAVNLSTLYPSKGVNTLADQLQIVARLVAGGLKTKVYMVSLGGFDTHSAQVANTGGTETGAHATLLGKISEAVNAFQDDLKLLKVEDRVLGMTFSEFGRRIKSNDSLGTDHGAAAPLFVFGNKVNGGIYGKNPTIPVNPSPGDSIAMQVDFRSIYSTILKEWFGVADQELSSIMLKDFPSIPFINSSTTGLNQSMVAGDFGLSNYPNPANDFSIIRFGSKGENINISLYDNLGNKMFEITNGYYPYGQHEVKIDTSSLSSGWYVYQLISNSSKQSKKLVVER
jgi:hypothetical protein